MMTVRTKRKQSVMTRYEKLAQREHGWESTTDVRSDLVVNSVGLEMKCRSEVALRRGSEIGVDVR